MSILLSQILLPLASLLYLIIGLFKKNEKTLYTTLLFIIGALVTSSFFEVIHFSSSSGLTSHEGFLTLTNFLLMMVTGFIVLGNSSRHGQRYEYHVLLLLALLGLIYAVWATHLLSLFLGLEILSISLYILVAMEKGAKANEAAMKYFLLGILASGVMLFGLSLIYGTTGSLDYLAIRKWVDLYQYKLVFSDFKGGSIFMMGISFFIAALAFKLALAPFHAWAPDVYEGANTKTTLLVATLPKLGVFIVLVKLLFGPLLLLKNYWQDLMIILVLMSLVIAPFAALMQTSLKRFIAYSSISNMAFALLGLCSTTNDGLYASLFYVLFYVIATYGLFLMILKFEHTRFNIHQIDDLRGLFSICPRSTLQLTFFLFSLSGVPPFTGFIAKLNVFRAILAKEMYGLAFITILMTVVSAAYYLRLIGLMFFYDPKDVSTPRRTTYYDSYSYLKLVASIFLTLLLIYPGTVMLVIRQLVTGMLAF